MLVHSIYVFLICNPRQRFLALLLEGQGRTTEEQVPGMEPLQSMICQLPPPGICCVLNSKNLFQKQKTHSGLHAKMVSWQPRAGGIAQGASHVHTGQPTLQGHSATRPARRSWGEGRDGVRWKMQIHAGGETPFENRLYSCPARSMLLGSQFISIA